MKNFLLLSLFLFSCRSTDDNQKKHRTKKINKTTQQKIKILGVVYEQGHKHKDFSEMIENPKYKDSLFIFNDNEEDHNSSRAGGGNAVIRPYNSHGTHSKYPRSAGIPTGKNGRGYLNLSEGKNQIDFSIEEIRNLIKKHKYKKIIYSRGKNSDLIGQSIFKIDRKTREYITEKIYSLSPFDLNSYSNMNAKQYSKIVAAKIVEKTGSNFPTIINKTGGVAILLSDGNRVLLHKRYSRAKGGANSLTSGGGSIDKGEYPLEAGLRELAEEAGFVIKNQTALDELEFYNLDKLILKNKFDPSKGRVHFYLIKGSKKLINSLMDNKQLKDSRKDKWEYQDPKKWWKDNKRADGTSYKFVCRQIWVDKDEYFDLNLQLSLTPWKLYENRGLKASASLNLIDPNFKNI